MQSSGKKTTVAIYIPKTILDLAEDARGHLGMNRSKFVQYCILRTLQDLSLLTKAVHAEPKGEAEASRE